MKHIILLIIVISFITNCSQKVSRNMEKDKFLIMLAITKDSVWGHHNVINEKLITYDTINKKILLLPLTEYQRQLSIGKILPANNPAYMAYLIEIQERLSNVFTVIIYLDTDDIAPIYLLNYKDTVLVDYIYHDGSYVYYTESEDDKEIIFGYQRWFEFHHDTIYKIENNIHDEYYANSGNQIERSKDSIITKYKIDKNGKFNKIFYDSIPNK